MRDRIVKAGAPNGGNGGKGGDIYIKSVKNLFDLSHFKKPVIIGNNGRSGMKEKKDGKCGGDLKISVPIGTLVYEI